MPQPPVAVLYSSSLFLFHPSKLWFATGEGSRPSFNHHTTGGHHSLRRCLFWIPGGPECPEWSVLRSACWEEGGDSRWQRLRVSRPDKLFMFHDIWHLIRMCKSYVMNQWGGDACSSQLNDAEYQSHVWLQEEHHCAVVVPLLWAPAGKHLHSGPEYPRRQSWQLEEGSGCCTSGLEFTLTIMNKQCNSFQIVFCPVLLLSCVLLFFHHNSKIVCHLLSYYS